MCVYSAIGDYANTNWPIRYPFIEPWVAPHASGFPVTAPPAPTMEEFEALCAEVRALRDLLKAAKIYDELTHQPDCEMDEKVELIRQVAKFVGIDLEDAL